MDLNEIAVFIKVVQAGSFTRAARQLSMPNSTVSTRVSSLERRLGVTLLQRTTRQLNLTQAGQAYYEQCLAGLEEIVRAENEVTATQTEPRGNIRITAPVFLGGLLLADVLSTCQKKYPKIDIEVLLQDRKVDLVVEKVDVALRAGDLGDSSLIARKLGTVRFAAFASPEYLQKNGKPSHPKELKNHKCLQFTPFGRDHWRFFNGKNSLTIPLPGSLLVDDLQLIKKLALEGGGIALLPLFDCEEEKKKKQLVPVFSIWHSLRRELHLVYPQQKFPSPKIQAFVSVALEEIKKQISRFE